MGPTPVQPAVPSGTGTRAEETAAGMLPVDGDRVLDLVQQGYTTTEIADLLNGSAAAVGQTLDDIVPGGFIAVRSALRSRLRAWRRDNDADDWLEAEPRFGVPHINILRLVRAAETEPDPDADHMMSGFLDAALDVDPLNGGRAEICARGYAMGATLQELGDRLGVTRERIRQILARDTHWSSTTIAAAVRRLRAARRAEQKRAVEQWSTDNPAASLGDAVVALGMSEAQVQDLLGSRRNRHVPAGPRSVQRYSDEDILEDLRDYHRQTGSTTAAGFTEWARDQGVPGHQTVSIRFGTWNDALSAAGVKRAVGTTRSGFTDEDLWSAVVAFVRAPDGGTTARAAEGWFKVRPAAPSSALIRQRLNTPWSEIVTTALAIARGESDHDSEFLTAVTADRDWFAVPEQIDDVQHVRDAIAELGPRVSSQRFTRWAREQRRPTMATLMRRTGKSWTELVLEAGGTPNRSRWSGGGE